MQSALTVFALVTDSHACEAGPPTIIYLNWGESAGGAGSGLGDVLAIPLCDWERFRAKDNCSKGRGCGGELATKVSVWSRPC